VKHLSHGIRVWIIVGLYVEDDSTGSWVVGGVCVEDSSMVS